MPEAVQVEEADTAKFLAKIGGFPRPRLTWWVNGAITVNVSFKSLSSDFHILCHF